MKSDEGTISADEDAVTSLFKEASFHLCCASSVGPFWNELKKVHKILPDHLFEEGADETADSQAAKEK